ncbi:MAG: hypothetical protein FH748_13805 [Balneolaceae bacterium]|nr:hypothetical protein [Balneolaceae bacterium]
MSINQVARLFRIQFGMKVVFVLPNTKKKIFFSLKLLLVVIFGTAIGFLLGFVSNVYLSQNVVTATDISLYVGIYTGVILLLIDLLPIPKNTTFSLPGYYPVSHLTVFGINFFYDLFRYNILFVTITLTSFYISVNTLNMPMVLISSAVPGCVYILNRMLIQQIFYRKKKGKMLISGLILICAIGFYYSYVFGINLLVWLGLLLSGIVFYHKIFTARNTYLVNNTKWKKSSFIKLITRRKDTMGLVYVGLFFKTMIVAGYIVAYYLTGKFMFDTILVFLLACSPLFMFSYFGFNFFGVFSSLFFVHALRERELGSLVQMYLKMMIRTTPFDLGFFLIAMISIDQLNIRNMVFYATFYFLCLGIGFVISITKPVIKDNFALFNSDSQQKNHMSKQASYSIIIVMLIAFGLYFLPFQFQLMISVLLVLSTLLFVKSFLQRKLDVNKRVHDFYFRDKGKL